MEFAGRQFEMDRGGTPEGMFLWATEIRHDGTRTVVLQACWRDSDNSVTFSAFEEGLPFELVEMFVANVRPALTPTLRVPPVWEG